MNTRAAVYTGAALVGAATAVTSAVSLYRLAQYCAIDGWLAAALPIALDAGAVVGALAWITERGQVRVWGRGIAVGALVASLLGNGLEHAVAAGLLRPTLPLILVVGAAIPAALWACVHLAALMSTKPSPGRVRSSKKLGGDSAPGTTTPTPPKPTALVSPRSGRDERVEWLVARPAESYAKEIAAVCERFGVSDSTAKRIRRVARGRESA